MKLIYQIKHRGMFHEMEAPVALFDGDPEKVLLWFVNNTPYRLCDYFNLFDVTGERIVTVDHHRIDYRVNELKKLRVEARGMETEDLLEHDLFPTFGTDQGWLAIVNDELERRETVNRDINGGFLS